MRSVIGLTALVLGAILLATTGLLLYLRQSPSNAMSIVFTTRDDNMITIHRMHPAGTHIHTVAIIRPNPTVFTTTSPTFSHDGQWLFFLSSDDGDVDLLRMRSNGSELQRLTHNDVTDRGILLSPDGEWIAYYSVVYNDAEVYQMRVDGSDQKRLTFGNNHEFPSTWAADGQSIYFLRSPERRQHLYRVDLDSEQIEQVHPVNLVSGFPFWSNDREWLYFTSLVDGANGVELYRMRTDGSDPEYLTDVAGFFEPSFSPDGEWIVHTSWEDGDSEIYRIRPDGSDRQQLTYNETQETAVGFSPDGQWILFEGGNFGNLELFRMHPDGSNVQQLTHNQVEEHEATYSPLIDLPLNYLPLFIISAALMIFPLGFSFLTRRLIA